MQVLNVKEYHRIKAIEHINSIDYPTWMFEYCGRERKTGYVAFDNRRAILRDTKKQAIAAWNGLAG